MRKSPLKRGDKWLRRRSKNPRKRLLKLADDALQNWYRKKYAGKPCEGCGKPFNLMHHHIPKSQSNYARYGQPDNLIFLCRGCHNAIHFGGCNVVSIYTLKRGKKWEQRIRDMARIKISLGIKDLEDIIKKYA